MTSEYMHTYDASLGKLSRATDPTERSVRVEPMRVYADPFADPILPLASACRVSIEF